MTDVSANPLNVVISLAYGPLNAEATQNGQYQFLNQSLLSVLPLLPASLVSQLSPITPFVLTPLGQLFNNAWTNLLPTEQKDLANQFTQVAGQSVSNVSCTLASSGTVLAGVSPAQGSTPANVAIDFQLPGGNFYFNAGPLSAEWRINFDADLSVSTPVPVQPFNFSPVVIATLSNASLNADNFGANVDQFFDNFLTGLGNFFLSSNFVSDVDWWQQTVPREVDGSEVIVGPAAAPLVSLFNSLNNAGPQCASLGFTECAFSIVGSTLTLSVTHPLDPGPTIVGAFNQPQLVAPTLMATAKEATPGSSITAIGSQFPIDSSHALELEWPNTSSGTPTEAQIQYQGQTQTIAAPSNVGSFLYTYQATALTPGKTYVFEARCGDQLTWSQWGPPLSLTTATTGVVDLVLVGVGESWTLGSALLPTANAQWICPGTIPATVPLGDYYLQAVQGGTVIAATPLSIVATLTPQIEVIDPATNAIANPPYYMTGGMPFTLQGFGFPNGLVTIAVNGSTVETVAATGGAFTVNLTTPGDAYTEETVNVTATEGGVTATLNPPILLLGQPK
ncbi:MAG TPA: hypothetical protein VEK34_03050 [Methylocella sp.]|nr:hypothetical protein [Methylocella sp.]